MTPASTTLIISSYNQPRALAMVLDGVSRQTRRPDEIIIADDGSKPQTFEVIERCAKQFNLPLEVMTQEDLGYRRLLALNRAAIRSKGQQLLFLDGDVIPPPHWTERHAASFRPMGYSAGTYLRLELEPSEDVIRSGLEGLDWSKYLSTWEAWRRRSKAVRANFHILTRNRKRPKLWGGNWSVDRGLFFGVNGFEERLEGFGGGDSEIRNRMNNYGGKPTSLIYDTFCLHLHPGLDFDWKPGMRNRGLTHDGPYKSLRKNRWAEVGLTSHVFEPPPPKP